MKQEQIKSYNINYPKKLLKSVVLTAAAATLLGNTGCKILEPTVSGYIDIETPPATVEPVETDEPTLDGMISIDEMP